MSYTLITPCEGYKSIKHQLPRLFTMLLTPQCKASTTVGQAGTASGTSRGVKSVGKSLSSVSPGTSHSVSSPLTMTTHSGIIYADVHTVMVVHLHLLLLVVYQETSLQEQRIMRICYKWLNFRQCLIYVLIPDDIDLEKNYYCKQFRQTEHYGDYHLCFVKFKACKNIHTLQPPPNSWNIEAVKNETVAVCTRNPC